MVLWKHFIIVFGGFFDNHSEMKYYDDLWAFDTQSFLWSEVACENKPSPRSGFQLFAAKDAVCVYGGFSKAGQKTIVYSGSLSLTRCFF